ncbi:glycoside hydrolase family 93 protein [Coleophoma cylindrospora]|uniref:Glycoside hydrolase family 93 protein n=1 Tax=Coleophoma cylindrospora TaxID=1849047 RepID=A0A3D8QS96_9HELO|nr:glycoside hydrolase family 93 protein [Coleophoma cylindrospora]
MFGGRGFSTGLVLATTILCAYSAPALEIRAVADHAVTFQTIYVPPATYNTPKTLYARTVQLADGTLLATWENYSPEPPMVYFPIYRSTDKGETWTSFSTVQDQVNGWGLRYQPSLYLLPQTIGNLTKGTILCAGNSIPTDLSQTKIDLYASQDSGATWSFVSSIASGGAADPSNGQTPVWEPFLMVYDNQLVAYYSDQRDPAHGQKLVHQVSSDGITWGAIVDDVAYPTYSQRPGMTTIAPLPNGQWIVTYEYGGGPNPRNAGYPIYYRISPSPLTFNNATGVLLNANGTIPSSSPYVVWSPSGGVNGTIAVSANSHSQIFVNTKLGDASSWVIYSTPQAAAYSRHLRVMDDPDYLLIMGGGPLGGDNSVTDSVMKLPNL